MPTTKTRTALFTSQSLVAGAGDTTSALATLTTGYGASLNIRFTNGATGPTNPAEVSIQVSNDNVTFEDFGGRLRASTDNSGVSTWGGIEIPIGVQYLRLSAGSNTGQNVTIDADISEVSTV